jgi:hypothetical protein
MKQVLPDRRPPGNRQLLLALGAEGRGAPPDSAKNDAAPNAPTVSRNSRRFGTVPVMGVSR